MQENDSKKYTADGYDLTYSSGWIHELESLQHWIYYWNQASLVWNYVDKNDKLIEIGIGTGFLKNYLKSKGWDCTTIDIDQDKKPDMICDISSMDLSELAFECVIAFEIFEHLPYPLFKRAIYNIAQRRPKYIIFSLPLSMRRVFEFKMKLPRLKEKKIEFNIKRNKIRTPNHFWELKKQGDVSPQILYQGDKGIIPMKNLRELFSSVGYNLKTKQKIDNIQFFVATTMK